MKRHLVDLSTAVQVWTRQLSQVRQLILPVIANLAITLFAWVGVYKMKIDDDNVAFYLLDSGKNMTTGNDLYDGLLNGVSSIVLLAVVSFTMLALALYDFKRVVQAWLTTSCVLVMFGLSSTFINDALKEFGIDDPYYVIVSILTLLYGGLGSVVFFTSLLPLSMHQIFVLTNCSLVSVFYLRTLPGHTVWSVLCAIVLWDLFAVLTPIGPLKLVQEKAAEYSDGVLRLLMFEATDDSNVQHGESETAVGSSQDNTVHRASQQQSHSTHDSQAEEMDAATAETISEEDLRKIDVQRDSHTGEGTEYEQRTTKSDSSESNESIEYLSFNVQATTTATADKGGKTALDALHDPNSIHLGMGDFVFYSLLVGKAAMSGSVAATVAAGVGVVVGLILTLSVFSDSESTCPALPLSVLIGMGLHFGTIHLILPFLHTLSLLNSDMQISDVNQESFPFVLI